MAGGENMPPWLSREGPQLKPDVVETKPPEPPKPPERSVTFAWNPPLPSDPRVAGYKVYVATVSATFQRTFDAGAATELQVSLPTGESYYCAVAAYNSVGESEPSTYVQFDLF
jgi:Fibronectin type III domain